MNIKSYFDDLHSQIKAEISQAKESLIVAVAQGIDLKLIKMPRGSNYMHHKFAVVDESTLLNGSFNWSINAEKSFENLLVIKNEPDVVRSFMLEYSKIEKLDYSAIKSLQTLERCQKKDCSGKRLNILVGKTLIHAIGFVSREHYSPDDETVFTCIMWKNKFVDNVILDRYESNFGVLYE